LDGEVFYGDIRDREKVEKAVEGVEGVYHLAAIYALWRKDPVEIYEVNVGGTRNLIQSVLRRGIRMVFTSSIAALGVSAGKVPATEETPFCGWRYANPYILSKYESELEVLSFVRKGLQAVVVNPSFPFGPGDYGPTPTGNLLLQALRGRVFGYIEGGINGVDVRDVAYGHILAMEKGKVGEKYLLANKDGNITYRDFLQIVSKITGKTYPDRKVSPRLYAWVAWGMEKTFPLFGKVPPMTYKTALYGAQYLYYDPTKAIQELGLPQSPLEEAIRSAAEWFEENGYV
jgi:dihydroflavonol-4-reductase